MDTISATRSAAGRDSQGYRFAMGLIALLLAATVFYVDTFTNIESAIAVLYVIVLMLASEVFGSREILASSACCICLTLFSYAYFHGLSEDLPALLRLAVSLSALFITCALLLRNDRSRQALLESYAALRDSEKRYRAIFDESRVALWERDYTAVRSRLMQLKSEGTGDLKAYARANPGIIAECIGLIRTIAANEAARELLGAGDRMPPQYIAPEDDTFLEVMNAIYTESSHFEGKGTITTASGETKLVLLSMSLPDEPAGFARVVVGMVDITQREMVQKALLEVQADLTRASRAATVGALSASLAHELNQPLGAIVVNAQTLLRWLDRTPPDLDAVKRSAERMVRDSERASEIIHNTRSMLAKESPSLEAVHLSELIEETRALLEHELTREAVTFEIDHKAPSRKVQAVRIELQQVLINLITNAVQAMSTSDTLVKRLIVSVENRDEHHVRMSVRDFGPGISEAAIEKVFTPFYTTKPSGMGMGLSICRSTMEARGGQLNATNHPEGGAIFEMIIPIEDAHAGA